MPARNPKSANPVMAHKDFLEAKQRAIESEESGRHSEAGAAFEEVGMPQDALRNWRVAGDFEKALPLAKGKAKADLRWLIRAEKHMRRRPHGIQDRLTVAERRRLAKAMRVPRPKKRLFD